MDKDIRKHYFKMMEKVLDFIEVIAPTDELYKRARRKILRLFNDFDRDYFPEGEETD